ncbi:hypothetical protein L3X07_03245 [Levilactobacillus brevis]|nr:hypothetical protein [Levilactobacillus brevis]
MTITIDHLETAVNLFYEVGLTAGHTYANNASVTYTTPGTGVPILILVTATQLMSRRRSSPIQP